MPRDSSPEERHRRHRSKSRDRDRKEDKDGSEKRKRSGRSPSSSSSSSSDSDSGRDREKHRKRRKERHEKRKDKHGRKSSKERERGRDKEKVEDETEEDLWVEKPSLATAQLPVQQEREVKPPASSEPPKRPAQDDWMSFGQSAARPEQDNLAGNDEDVAVDPWSSMLSSATSQRKSKAELLEEKRAAEAKTREMGRSSMELNPFWKDGGDGLPPASNKRKYEFGDAGSNWRMIKLRKVKEIAEEEGRKVEEVALERYGSLEDYEEALAERRFLDEQRGGRSGSSSGAGNAARGSGSGRDRNDGDYSARSHLSLKGDTFRRPGGKEPRADSPSSRSDARSASGTPNPEAKLEATSSGRFTPTPRTASPAIPSVLPPTSSSSSSKPVLTTDQLNKMNAKILKARLMKDPNLAALEKEYEAEKRRAAEAPAATAASSGNDTIVIPALDSRGRLQDLPGSSSSGPKSVGPPKKSKPWQADRNQGDRDADPNQAPDLMELLRREKMGADEDFDREFAERIAKDTSFRSSLDYLDEQSDRMARQVNRSDDKKKQYAINDYKKVQSALESCPYCYQDEGKTAPKVPVVSLGNKTYLGLTQTIEMVKGHCVIVPVQHVNNSLEMDDDAWEEVRVGLSRCLNDVFSLVC